MSVSGVGTSILNKSFKSQLYYIEFDKFDNFPFQPFSSQAPGQALRLARGAGRANHSEILRQHAERF